MTQQPLHIGPPLNSSSPSGVPANQFPACPQMREVYLSQHELEPIFVKVTSPDPQVPQIAKFYRQQDPQDGPINRDRTAPHPLLLRELECLKILSPSLAPRIELVEIADGHKVLALVMRELNPTSFLDQRLARKESIQPEVLRELAGKLVNFHFDSSVCERIRGKLSLIISTQSIAWESALLRDSTGKAEVDSAQIRRWFDVVRGHVQIYSRLIDVVAGVFREPIRGHGAISSENIAITDEGEILIVGTASDQRQTTTRRMDAALLYAELVILNRLGDADLLLAHYNNEYQKRSGVESRKFDHASIQRGEGLIDAVSYFYSLVNLYHRSFQGVDLERRQRIVELIEEVVNKFGSAPDLQLAVTG